MRSRALLFTAPKSVSIVDVELPPVQLGQVLIRTLYSGISSGTEMLAYRGEIDPGTPLDDSIDALDGTFAYPFRYGYSCVGLVQETRSELSEGTLVFTLHPHQTSFVTDAADAIRCDDVDPRAATLFPLVETAFQVTLDAGELDDKRVIVLGLGAVGALTSVLLARSGANVIAADPVPWRRAVARDCGIEAVDPAALSRVAEDGVGLVVEASGSPAALVDALGLLAHEGIALVVSWYGTKPVALPLGADFHRKRLTIRSTQVSTIPSHLADEWTYDKRRAHVSRLLPDLPLKQLATHEFAFEEAAAAYDAIERGVEGLVHTALRHDPLP